MNNKHIKLYEEHSMEATALAIYESTMKRIKETSRLNEQDEWDEDEEMTAGENRAFERGLQIMSKPQMAALYLLAKGKSIDAGADYIKMIPGIEGFGYTDETDGTFSITTPAIADAIGMDSDRTLNYTQRKFQNMIDGVGETMSQSLSPKLVKAYDALSKMTDSNIVAIASDAIQDISNTKNRDSADSRREGHNEKAAVRNANIKVEKETLVKTIHQLVLDFKADGNVPMSVYSKLIWKGMEKEYPRFNMKSMYELYTSFLRDMQLPVQIHIDRPIVA